MSNGTRYVALRVAAIYAFFSSLWILFSDQTVLLLVSDPETLTAIQSIKGWAFVVLSALVIFALLHRELLKLEQTQFALDDQRVFLNALLDNSPTVMYMKDREGRYVSANRHFCELYQVNPSDLEGKTDHDLFPDDVALALRENDLQVLQSASTGPYREDVPEPDGEQHNYISVKFPVQDRNGKTVGVCGISSDITKRVELERELQRNEHMSALGRLTGGIAHDFNNHLTVIRGNLELLAGSGDVPAEADNRVRDALHATSQAASLVDRLLSFSRNQILRVDSVELNGIAEHMHELLARSLGESVVLEIATTEEPLYSLVDPVQLESALLNLAVNARDAMPRGGTLAIRTRRETVSARQAARDGIAEGCYVCIDMEDTGEGIAPGLLDNVFQPFFTTKEPGKGTGLGLSMVDGFLRQSGGCTRIRSALGKGTVVTLLLPESIAPADKPGDESERAFAGSGSGEYILVVEDQEPLRILASKVLQEKGYNVVTAVDGPTAIAALDQERPIDMLFSDVVLPGGVTGPELAHQFLEVFPAGRVLLTSGFADAEILMTEDGAPDFPLLRKPYGIADLLQAINANMGSKEGA